MNLLFTADLHIKLGQKNVPVSWSKNRFSMFLDQLQIMQEKCDLLVLGGDIFDTLPSLQELELYFNLVKSIIIPCVLYPGNHEATGKFTSFFSYLEEVTYDLNPNIEIVTDFCSLKGIDFIPYNKLKCKSYPKPSSNILCTHVRGAIPPHVKPEIDLNLLKNWEIVLAGDLHSYSNSQGNILYPGAPYTIDFHRKKVDTGAIILDTETLQHSWEKFSLPQLLKKTVLDEKEIIKSDFDHTMYEIKGNLSDLSSVKDNPLLDKKILNKQTNELSVNLTGSMCEELNTYLSQVLLLNKSQVSSILSEFENHRGNLHL